MDGWHEDWPCLCWWKFWLVKDHCCGWSWDFCWGGGMVCLEDCSWRFMVKTAFLNNDLSRLWRVQSANRRTMAFTSLVAIDVALEHESISLRTTAPKRRRRVCGGWSSNMCPCDPRKLLCHVGDLGSFQWFGLWVFEQSCAVPWQLLTAVCDGDGIVCFGGFLYVMIRTKDYQDLMFSFRGGSFFWLDPLRSPQWDPFTVHSRVLKSPPTSPTFQLLPGRLEAFKFLPIFGVLALAPRLLGETTLALRAASSIAEVAPRNSEQLLRGAWLTLALDTTESVSWATKLAERSLEEREEFGGWGIRDGIFWMDVYIDVLYTSSQVCAIWIYIDVCVWLFKLFFSLWQRCTYNYSPLRLCMCFVGEWCRVLSLAYINLANSWRLLPLKRTLPLVWLR